MKSSFYKYFTDESQLKGIYNLSYSSLSRSICTILDCLPYPILIRTSNEPICTFYNSKLIDLLEIPEEEKASDNLIDKIKNKLENLKITVFDDSNSASDPKLGMSRNSMKPSNNQSDRDLSNSKSEELLSGPKFGKFVKKEETKNYLNPRFQSDEYHSENSVSDSENEINRKEGTVKRSSYQIGVIQTTLLNCLKKNKYVEAKIGTKRFVLQNKLIKWNQGDAIMHIFNEQNKVYDNCSHLWNSNSKAMLKEIKSLITSMIGEKDQSKNQDSLMTTLSVVNELITFVSASNFDRSESKKENHNINFMGDEVYKILSDKIEEKQMKTLVHKVNNIQNNAQEFKSINMRNERVIVKQIMLNLISSTILKADSGQVKVECSFEIDINNQIKVGISNQNKMINNDMSKAPINNQPSEDADFLLSKMMIEKLGGKLWAENDISKGNVVYFTFNVENNQNDVAGSEDDEEMNISEYGSSKECINVIPLCLFNNTPFSNKPVMAIEEIKISEPSINQASQKQCCPKILLVDDNYFNIEVLQSLIEVQLNFECDSAFNGLEALNKVKDRYKKTCCTHYYSYIFMDINMPIMDGYCSSSEIKTFLKKEALKSKTKVCPTTIFAVTAQKEVVENEQNVFDGIILKPISIEGLRKILVA